MNQARPLRFATYNIRKCIGLDRRRKPERIVEVLNSIGADVVALQEADRRLGKRPAALSARLIETETDFVPVAVPGRDDGVGWHGNAVLLRRGLEAVSVEPIELSGTEPRGALVVELKDGMRIAAVHLGLLRSDRRAQLAQVHARVAGADGTVILGDFNEWSRTRGVEPLGHLFRVHTPGRSFHAARPLAALDRIATGPGVTLVQGGVVETRLSRVASDHLPVWADLVAA